MSTSMHSMDEGGGTDEEVQKARQVLERFTSHDGLVNVLLQVQQEVGYLPERVMEQVARHMEVSPTRVYSVASFYNQFRFTHPGRRRIQVCMGTACHVKRGQIVLDAFERKLEIHEGTVTEDREYGLTRVNCVGCCALAPVVVVDDEVHGDMSPTRVDGMLMQLERERRERDEGDG